MQDVGLDGSWFEKGSPYITHLLELTSSSVRARFCGVTPVELSDGVIRVEIVPWDPLIVVRIVALPFDQVLRASIPSPRVEDPFHFVVVLPINHHRVRGTDLTSTCEGVGGEWKELDDGEDGVQAAHRLREAEAIRSKSDCGFDFERSKSKAVELLAGPIGAYVGRVEQNEIARLELRGGFATAVVILRVLILSLAHRGLRFVQSDTHALLERRCILVRYVNQRLKTHPRISACVRHEG